MQNGDQVIAAGSVDVYARTGSYQLYANQIIRDGVGVLAERFEQLKKKLLEQGMFDASYKQPIPSYIRTLGVVTAPTGAAVRDIINIAHRRNPYVQIILYPAVVQGEYAQDSIINGIHALEELGVDVMIIGRGGGSIEDLWAFNEERVAEAVFNCSVPIISAVGHETDTVITDYVADLRAPTPSAAAELAVFDYQRFMQELSVFETRMREQLLHGVALRRRQCEAFARELRIRSPRARIRDQRLELDRLSERMQLLMDNRIRLRRQETDLREQLDLRMESRLKTAKHRLELAAAELSFRSPLQRLSGGYGFVRDEEGRTVTSAAQTAPGQHLRIRMRDGEIGSRVEYIDREGLTWEKTKGISG